jgi:prepilin-type N-terminal cleavage/methylation domain-containing protein
MRMRLIEARGLTLIEMAIVLSVIGVIVAAIWVVAATTSENAKQHSFASQHQQIVQNMRQVCQRLNIFAAPYSTNITQEYDRQAVFPRELRLTQPATDAAADGNLNHQWTDFGVITTGTIQLWKINSTLFEIRYLRMPRKACVNLAIKLTGGELGMDRLIVGGTTFRASNGNVPATTTDATTACASATNNTMRWFYSLRAP